MKNYIYIYSYEEDEKSLCAMEMRAFFGHDSQTSTIESPIQVNPSRSPFIQERIAVIYEGKTLEDIKRQVQNLELVRSTFKVVFVKNRDLTEDEKVGFKERRKIEREIGLQITGEPNLHNPDIILAIAHMNGRWVFGTYTKNEAIWLQHKTKPHSYSTALSARVARAVVNIAVPDPNPNGIKVIDPCCGIGTVLVEALSMGIDIIGSDRNPLVLPGARENIEHFGLEGEVVLKDILDVKEHYDVAIIDLPYNVCSVITSEQQFNMLQSARRFANKVVIITVEEIDSIINAAEFEIVDRCVVKKGKFTRQVIVGE